MNQDKLLEQIAAYCEGEMSDEERVSFEQRMAENDAFRSMAQSWRETMEAAREWQHTSAPGEERVDSLPIPTVVWKPIRPPWRQLAAAALFVAGFSLGVLAQRGMNVLDSSGEPTISRPAFPEKAVMIPTEPTRIPVESNPKIGENKQEASNRTRVTKAVKPVYTHEQDGRLVIETTLVNSGARAVWIVDSGFQLPKKDTDTQGEKP